MRWHVIINEAVDGAGFSGLTYRELDKLIEALVTVHGCSIREASATEQGKWWGDTSDHVWHLITDDPKNHFLIQALLPQRSPPIRFWIFTDAELTDYIESLG